MSKVIYQSLPSMKEARNRVDQCERYVDRVVVPENVKSFAKGKTFFIRTFGCQANIRDEEVMAGYLSEAGFQRTEDPRAADLAIINTCAVRENAEDKVYGEIGSFKANRTANPDFILCVCGCMMQEEGSAEYLEKTYPFVSLVFGTHNVHQLLPMLGDLLKKRANIVNVLSHPGEVVEGLPSVRLDEYEAFVNISYGCDKFCTYCIVPYTRGRERSRRKEDILAECKALVDSGYKQITLLGQNVNSYGLDLKDGTNFASLLADVAELGIPRLKFLTSYPSQFTDEMIDTMARYPNILKWLHFPVQSGSSSCLRRMGRRYTREEYLEIVSRIRAKMPDIALTTDIIVGFPNETEEEFADTLSLAEEVSYSAAFTFIYSPRRGTPAARLVDETSDKTKHERFNRLVKVIEKTTGAHSDAMVGKVYEVLVEGPSKKNSKILSGYAENGKLVNFPGPAYLKGCFAKVKITESKTFSLRGELVEDPLIVKARDIAFLMGLDPALRESKALIDVLSSEEYRNLGKEIAAAKKEVAMAMGGPHHAEAKEKLLALEERVHNDPILHNYEATKDELRASLEEIEEILR